MPNRFIHEKLCVSQTIASLSAEEERFFYRLLVKCDDFGRFYAQPTLLRAACFPLLLESVSDADVETWRDRLAAVGLIEIYESGGLSYLVVTTWDAYQRRRASVSKFPAPPSAATRGHLPASGGQMSPVSGIRNPVFDVRDSDATCASAHGSAAPPPAAAAAANGPDESAVPAALAGFHEVMSGVQGYQPSAAFLRQVAERYGALDLTEEALKMASWLADPERNRGKRSATTRFVLNWLKKSLESDAHSEKTPDLPDDDGSACGESLAPPSAADAALWDGARSDLAEQMSRPNWETYIAPLGVAGRGADGGLRLRAPPGLGDSLRRFRAVIVRSLDDAGDPRATRVAIVEARPGQE